MVSKVVKYMFVMIMMSWVESIVSVEEGESQESKQLKFMVMTAKIVRGLVFIQKW